MCVCALEETINYYYSLSKPTYVSFIVVKNEFDRVSHGKIFLKLALKRTSAHIALLMFSWYKHQTICVEWDVLRTHFLYLSNDIRQGLMISPYLFNIYVEEFN